MKADELKLSNELKEQIAVVDYCTLRGIDIVHIPNEGYRKASDVAREIFAEIETLLNLNKCYGDSGIYFERDIEADIAELKKKYESEGAE